MGILIRNPVDAVTIPKAERHEMQTMSESDIHIFLEMARPTQYYALFYTALFTWVKLIRRSGLNGIRLHDARHTHASLMLKQGIHPKIVQERLGHSSIQITLDTYSHVTPGIQHATAKTFAGIFKP
jgi:site-specific recombinase XerD